MKKFTVKTDANTSIKIEVDDTLFEKSQDMATEAMTQAIEKFLKFPEKFQIENKEQEAALSFIVIAQDEASTSPDDEFICLTSHILRNAGNHSLARECDNTIKEYIK